MKRRVFTTIFLTVVFLAPQLGSCFNGRAVARIIRGTELKMILFIVLLLI